MMMMVVVVVFVVVFVVVVRMTKKKEESVYAVVPTIRMDRRARTASKADGRDKAKAKVSVPRDGGTRRR